MSDVESVEKEMQKRRPSGIHTRIPKHKLSSSHQGTPEDELDEDEEFMPKAAFLLTTSYDVPLDRIAQICERIPFKGCLSLTKTATGILFKFSNLDDYHTLMKTGFHKVTGARFYRKIPIPCRPKKTFIIYVLDVPDELPVEDVRHAMHCYHSVIEVVRLIIYKPGTPTLDSSGLNKSMDALNIKGEGTEMFDRTEKRELPPAVIRITLASMDEYNDLLQNGLNFYNATFFPTEANISLKGAKLETKQGMLDGTTVSGRVRHLLPVFDASGFLKLPPPSSKIIKPARS